ncbi:MULTISPECIES: hypothetical protein [unclassified Mesorhizobium]|uniref:hypothetical protein n=1 Tax=unclassified Mesorhizobium TaxID=325217 RepID=UPI0033366C5E
MKTLKSCRAFTGSPISVRALGRLENRPLPISVLDMVATDGFRRFTGDISSGDVDCSWEMQLWQNGFWSAHGDFHDGGTLTGDFFYLELLLDHDHSIGARLEGHIVDVIESRHTSLSLEGSDRWVRDNWHKFESSGPTQRLHAAPAWGQLAWEGFVALYLAVGAFFYVVTGGGRSRYRMRRAAPQNPDPGDTRPGVEIDPDDDDEDYG